MVESFEFLTGLLFCRSNVSDTWWSPYSSIYRW